jgi:uncharacterized membrane protein
MSMAIKKKSFRYFALGMLVPIALFFVTAMLYSVTAYAVQIVVVTSFIGIELLRRHLGLIDQKTYDDWIAKQAHKDSVYSFFVGVASLFILGALGFLMIPILMITFS